MKKQLSFSLEVRHCDTDLHNRMETVSQSVKKHYLDNLFKPSLLLLTFQSTFYRSPMSVIISDIPVIKSIFVVIIWWISLGQIIPKLLVTFHIPTQLIISIKTEPGGPLDQGPQQLLLLHLLGRNLDCGSIDLSPQSNV